MKYIFIILILFFTMPKIALADGIGNGNATSVIGSGEPLSCGGENYSIEYFQFYQQVIPPVKKIPPFIEVPRYPHLVLDY